MLLESQNGLTCQTIADSLRQNLFFNSETKKADEAASYIDEAFMGIIREYPTIYDRSYKDFQDKSKKSNCWREVAQRLDEPVDIVKRHYESIRTQYSKYLRARKGASDCGYDDIPHTGKFKHLQWLKRGLHPSEPSHTNHP